MFGFGKKARVEKVLTALEGYTRTFGKAPAAVFSVADIERLLKMTDDVDTAAAMLTIAHAREISKQFVDRTDYGATVRSLLEGALRQGKDAGAVIEAEANGRYEEAKAFGNEFVRLLDEGRIIGTPQVRAFIAERATSHLAAWTLYRLRLQSAYEESLASNGTQIPSNDAGREKIERALHSLGRRAATTADSDNYATEATKTIVTALLERTRRPLLSIDEDGRFVGAIFAFVAGDIVSQMTGATFEIVSSVSVITLFFDAKHAAEGGTFVNEVSTTYNKLVRENPRVLQAIGQNLSAWLNAPTDAQFSKLGDLFEVCGASVRPG